MQEARGGRLSLGGSRQNTFLANVSLRKGRSAQSSGFSRAKTETA